MDLRVENRTRILEAAARVYAEYGYRGATTRRIATAAGVNEVTLFRTFGSKAALIDEARRSTAAAAGSARGAHAVTLPDIPADPERELTAWAVAQLAQLNVCRAFIRKAMAEFEERPDAAPCATEGWAEADRELRDYLRRLGEAGFVDWEALAEPTPRAGRLPARRTRGGGGGGGGTLALVPRSEHAEAAGAMLMAAIVSDAMGRDVRPELYPQPAERAPALYVKLFLRAVACRPRTTAARATRVRSRARAGGRTSPDRS
jgi:AcrR family transcriptional regulator